MRVVAVVLQRGGMARWAAVAVASPSFFIVLDFVRRAPIVWRPV